VWLLLQAAAVVAAVRLTQRQPHYLRQILFRQLIRMLFQIPSTRLVLAVVNL
jgi:hypothetical protein